MKLTAQELRIGNYVQFANYEPHQLEREELSYNENFANIEDYKPIPLTEQWLIDFGFEYVYDDEDDEDEESRIGMYKRGGFVYVNENQIGTNTDTESRILINNSIDYVHQLQNVYYCFTGKELTLNK